MQIILIKVAQQVDAIIKVVQITTPPMRQSHMSVNVGGQKNLIKLKLG